MAESNSSGKSTAHPGAVLRSIRVERGWTLAKVSECTGLPITTLSKIENDKLSLSYDKLVRISEGLGVDISRLFGAKGAGADASSAGTAPNGRRSVTLNGQGSTIETKVYSHLYPATDLLNKQFVPVFVELKAHSRGEFGQLIQHTGEEYALVLEGSVEFHTDLYAPLVLNLGDSIYFDSSMAHAYIAAKSTPCRILSVCWAEDKSGLAVPHENSD